MLFVPPRLLAERKAARATCLFSLLVCIPCIERLQLIASGQPASYEPATSRPYSGYKSWETHISFPQNTFGQTYFLCNVIDK